MKVSHAIAFFAAVLLSFSMYAQGGTPRILAGRVVDVWDEPLAGANVFVRGDTGNGTSTDANGYFSIELPDWSEILVEISFLGMKTSTVSYTGQKEITVVLEEDSNMMDGAVVTGKQNINDLDIRSKSGVITTVDVKRLQDKPMVDMSVALQGTAPGLVVTNRGDLGTKPEIRIRGNSSFREGDAANEPLFVLDGQVISSDAFMTLNPLDIADIKILKDAVACALYGTKASNGVIEITSVRGTTGEALVTYNFNAGITTRGRRGVLMMETDEKLELERRLRNPSAPGYLYSEEYIRETNPGAANIDELVAAGQAKLDELRKTNTDWFKELLRNDFYQRHNLSVRGGNSKTSYYASANYSYQGGQIPGNDVSRFTGRISLDQAVGQIGYVSVSVNGGYSKANSPNSPRDSQKPGLSTHPSFSIGCVNRIPTSRLTLRPDTRVPHSPTSPVPRIVPTRSTAPLIWTAFRPSALTASPRKKRATAKPSGSASPRASKTARTRSRSTMKPAA